MAFPRTITLEELKQFPVENIFQAVFSEHHSITVELPDGKEVIIQAGTQLKPLPELRGYIPQGWKEVIYHES